MIEGNILKFGYGDIAVKSGPYVDAIRFTQFKPPAECGDDLKGKAIEYIGEPVEIKFNSYKECIEFSKLMDSVLNKNIELFTFKDYIFDFTNYNELSVKACKGAIDIVINNYIRLMAC